MSTYVLMRLLESAPRRYDLGIRLLTLGRLDQAYDRLTRHIEAGQRVLDLGCGTGALTLRAAARGAVVKGIDVNSQMLEIAERRARQTHRTGDIVLAEMGVAELDREGVESYDVVTSGLCFSELSEDEVAYTLRQVVRILKPEGLLLVADEFRPRNVILRVLHRLVRTPLAVLTYLLTQQTTQAIAKLPERLRAAGFEIVSLRTSLLGSFAELVARKPAAGGP
jgi:demethylmenaquinone methyltransferase/2-methoxy-6-polyprenyl-1,4-benzoquinol methylase